MKKIKSDDLKKYDIKKLRKGDFSLVLSGGAAYGYAHIGVIKFLEENNLKPKEIIGSSMGALIGSMYAIGYSSDEMIEIAKNNPFFKLFDYGFLRPGLFRGKKIEKFLSKISDGKKISDCKIDLKIVTTNFDNGKVRVFDKTDDVKISDAVRCSISIPTIFLPHRLDGSYYVDGFLCSNLPVEFSSYKKILAVDVMNEKIIPAFRPKKYFLFSKLKILFRLANRTFTLMLVNQSKEKLANLKQNIYLLEPDMNGYNTFNFNHYKEISHRGYIEAKKRFE